MTIPAADRSRIHPGCRAMCEQARAEGVVHPGNLPFLLVPDKAQVAVLLVHGFTASPQEMRKLAEYLAQSGLAVLAIRLPGHGTTPKDLARRKWTEWAAVVADGYQLLAEQFPRVYGVGLSTGSLLLTTLALEHQINGMVLLSPYLRVKHRLAAYAGWIRYLRPYHDAPKNSEQSPFYYDRRPVAGVHQINKLVKHLQPQLARCTAPVLAINGEGDQTVDIATGQQLISRLGSPVKIYYRYGPSVPHVLTSEQNPFYREMFDMTLRFIREIDEPGELKYTDR